MTDPASGSRRSKEDGEMRLILVQHGEAQPKDIDPDRPLTAQGRRDIDALATWLSQRSLLPGSIWHSGKSRARQSAEALSAGTRPQARDGLGPTDDTAPWAEWLRLEMTDDLMLVGHQPFLARLAARLLTGAERDGLIGFRPGAAVCLERRDDADAAGDGGGWQLAWMLRPDLTGGA
jgi:phosphohistidine phosphatase